MITNYIKITLRNIYRNKLFSLVNIGGLIVGITCFLVIFTWVRYELSFDKYHDNADYIYRIIYKQNYPNQIIHSAVTPSPLGFALKTDYPEVEEFSRYTIFFGEILLSYENKKYYESNGAYADPGFLDMFSVDFIQGDKSNSLKEPYSIVLTENMAKKYFGNKDPINEILYLEGFAPLVVTGVIKNIPDNSHLHFDFLVPYILIEKWEVNIEDWNNWAHQYTYIQLNKNTDIDNFNMQIRNYLDKYEPKIAGELYLQKLKDIHFNTGLNYDNYSVLKNKYLVDIVLIVGFVILIIACLNYINLTISQYINRIKEVSIRKIVGADKSRLIKQFLIESFIITFFALHISLILIELIGSDFEILGANQLTLNYQNVWTLVTLISILMFVGMVSGIFPSIFLTSYEPVKVLKSIYTRRKGIISLRKILVIIQFMLASILVIISIYSYKQLNYIKNKDYGLNMDDIIAVQLRGKVDKYDVLKEELLKHENILGVSYGSSSSTINSSTSDDLEWNGKNEVNSFEVFSSSVDLDYLDIFDIEIISGRNFSRDFPSDITSSFIVNEEAVKAMGMKNPLGQKIKFMGKEGQIIGVTKNFHFLSLYDKIEPLIISIRQEWRYFLFVKLSPNKYENAIQYINSKWNILNPEFPLKYEFIKESSNEVYSSFDRTIKLILNFTIIAILIALLGLYALTSYIAKSRTKEIGIRKVVGASTKTILVILNLDFLKIIVLSFIIACPISYYILNEWMQQFAYKLNIGITLFLNAGILILLIALFTISFVVVNVSRKNPVESLRYE